MIGQYGLSDWWLTAFSPAERDHIEKTYDPSGSLTRGGPVTAIGANGEERGAVDLLTPLSGWFNNPRDRSIARRILLKAEELAGTSSILAQHFLYSEMIVTFYPDRDTEPSAFQMAVGACERQIALAPKAKKAFKQDDDRSAQLSRRFARELGTKVESRPPFKLPAHRGFTQLAIIREKEGKFDEALKLCQTAMKQGWDGDQEKRIARLEAKRAKKQKT